MRKLRGQRGKLKGMTDGMEETWGGLKHKIYLIASTGGSDRVARYLKKGHGAAALTVEWEGGRKGGATKRRVRDVVSAKGGFR